MNQETLTPEQREFRRKWVVLFSALESLVETGIKITAAILTGSAGLLADSIHSATDVAGSLMVWVGVRLAPHKFKRFPLGFYKIENLMALAIGFAILFGAYEILQVFIAGKNILPQNIPIGITAVLVSMTLDFFWGRFEAKSGRLINSPGIEASGNHTVSDVYSSAVVLVGLIGSLFGFNFDRWAALFVALIIVKMGATIIWDNLKVLLDISLDAKKIESYTDLLLRHPGVTLVKSISGRNAGSFRFLYLDLGVKAYELEQANEIVSSVRMALKENDPAIDMIFVQNAYELPPVVTIIIPSENDGRQVSAHFGKASYLTMLKYNRQTGQYTDLSTEPNPFHQEEKQRGIQLARYISNKGGDSVCCREDLQGKGPGLLLHQLGIDLRHTQSDDMQQLLSDYFGNSVALLAK
nr:cation diffusion facilitator family transporter [Desulfobulbaceae bacterium]